MLENIGSIVRAYLDRAPADKAIQFEDVWIGRRRLGQMVQEIADAIDAMAIPKDAPVGLVPQNRPEFIAALLALLAREQPIVMIYAYQSSEAMARKLRELDLPLIIAAQEQWRAPMNEAARDVGTGAIGLSLDRPNVVTLLRPAGEGRIRRAPAERGIRLLTSGTTGPPKLFQIDYEHLVNRVVANNAMATGPRNPLLHFYPLGNISGIYLLLPAIAANDPIVLLERFNVADWVDYVKTVTPQTMGLPPAAFRMILDAQINRSDLASLRFISTGAATLDPVLRREFEARYEIPILQSYGATEFGGVVTAVLPQHVKEYREAKSDSVGRPLGDVQLRITDPDTGAPMAVGTDGRIEVLVPAIREDWIATTDVGHLDDDGFLYHRGRLDGAIMRGGFKIVPEQVAEALSAHPAVATAAVVGVEDRRLGAVPAAAIELRRGVLQPNVEELARHLRSLLPAPALPKHYKIVDSLPRTPSMKVDLVAVRRLFEFCVNTQASDIKKVEDVLEALVAQVRAEYEELAAFLERLDQGTWTRHTVFFDWTIADEVMHLHLVDLFGLTAISDAKAFADLYREVRAGQAKGIELSQQMRERFGDFSPPELMATWKDTYEKLCGVFAASDPDAKMPWFGPEMRVSSFAAARQMEVWAHGQDIYDLLKVRRKNSDRITNICDLGVRTQGWSFRNRGLDKPSPPRVRLTAPSGTSWSWNDNASDEISGLAEDFALVVTQRRHVDDTGLNVVGADARRWMEIAQCFAGPPETGPAPGVRAVAYDDKVIGSAT